MNEAHLDGVKVCLYCSIAALTSFRLEHICSSTNRFRSAKSNSIGFKSGELAGASAFYD